MGIIKDGIKGGKIQLIASNLMKNIQNGGTIDNAKYLMENGHNGIYALYDKAKITTKEIAPMDAIDKAMGFRYGKGPGSLFLHGQCPMVAEVIHNLDNNWKVKNIYDGRPIHTYCEYKAPDGTTFYADARGITNNWDEFVSEFENELSTTDRASLLESNNIRDGVTNTMENGTRGYELTEQWVNGITPVFLTSTINESIYMENNYNYNFMVFNDKVESIDDIQLNDDCQYPQPVCQNESFYRNEPLENNNDINDINIDYFK